MTVTNNILNSGRGDIVNFNVGTGGNVNLTSDFVMRNNTIHKRPPDHPQRRRRLDHHDGRRGHHQLDLRHLVQQIPGSKGFGLLVAKTLGAGTAQGTIFNNRIGVDGTPGSSSTEASGLDVDSRGSGTHNVLIKNNQVTSGARTGRSRSSTTRAAAR